jgi:hypothetical protein
MQTIASHLPQDQNEQADLAAAVAFFRRIIGSPKPMSEYPLISSFINSARRAT